MPRMETTIEDSGYMAASDIVIKGAREHNLRDVSLSLPRNRLICFTGVSGSGKSSLAFDTLYAEGQRRYVESLSSFARHLLGQMPKPDVEFIGGLSPSISISQKTAGQNPRSTVGTITEIHDYLRVLFARVGQGYCPRCGDAITSQTREQILDRVLDLPEGTRFSILAPVIRQQKGEYRDLFEDLRKQGFVRARVDGEVVSLEEDLKLDRQMRHSIEVVVDRLAAKADVRTRLSEAVELALRIGEGNIVVTTDNQTSGNDTRAAKPRPSRGPRDGEIRLSAEYACVKCGLNFEPPSPQLFSFNSPQGMCLECSGLGRVYTFVPELLVPDASDSFRQGGIKPIGNWHDMGRWRRHIFQGVSDTMERVLGLDEGFLLDTPWERLDKRFQDLWLWGTGEEHITFTWKNGSHTQKYGGIFEGIIPQLMQKYMGSKSKMQRRQFEQYMRVVDCTVCRGSRLNAQAMFVRLTTRSSRFADCPELSLPEISSLPVTSAAEFFSELELSETKSVIAQEALKEVRGRLSFLKNVGLQYLTLDRSAPSLSGGEAQRIRLAGQIGCGLVGVLYILDEPSIGLHPRDNDRLLGTLVQLRDQGNTVVVVEHDEDTMRHADHLVDFGPGPGIRGGHVVAQGTLKDVISKRKSITGRFLSGRDGIEIPPQRRPGSGKYLRIVGAAENNLKNIDVEIPLGKLVCVTGVSGSGKSSLINDILVEALHRDLNGGDGSPGKHDRIDGLEHLDKLIAIDQSPIGRTPRSNPATYIKVFDDIRRLFAQLPESKRRGYKPGRFSFNVTGGRCESCEGNGSNRLEMDFLADIWVSCPVCEGHRFNHETLQVRFKGKSIADVLEMDVQESLEHFQNVPAIAHKLQTLHDVGLDYLKLGQPSPTLSGGEAQRIKLARELVKKSTGQTLYLLDEPTTGLHFADIKKLLEVLNGFVDAGNTVLVVEHNLDVAKNADWIIDLGPEGGENGGTLIAAGTPEQIIESEPSFTGAALRPILQRELTTTADGAGSPQWDGNSKPERVRQPEAKREILVKGAREHNLKGIDVSIPRDQMTVLCGPSGSGKTSLAMDTIYAEGQRRYVESLSAYARQFVGQMQKPKLDHIEGLSPAIAIEQKNVGHSPRSTVGTVTEVYDYMRILMARLGQPYCPDCDVPIGTQSADEIIDKILAEPSGTKLYLLAPLQIDKGQNYEAAWETIRGAGYLRIRVDGQTYSVDEPPTIDRRRRHLLEVVVDRIVVRPDARSRIADSVESTLALGKGVLNLAYVDPDVPEAKWQTRAHSQHYACDRCGRSFEPLTPHSFSFNSPLGWCSTCQGLGLQTGADPTELLRDTKLTLEEGAVAIWPRVDQPLFQLMLKALADHTGVPPDVPFARLTSRQRRVVMYGTDENWIEVRPAGAGKKDAPMFRFQYKGLYPALEEASRLSQSFRIRLDRIVREVACPDCDGVRIREEAAAVRFRDHTMGDLCRMPLGTLHEFFSRLKMTVRDRKIAGELVREVRNRVKFLTDVGLEYLTLSRPAPTLSGGESQRIRLASQVGSGLCGVLYVLDEPTIGLHARDNDRLIKALQELRNLGNTLLVVEHDRDVVAGADQLIDFGPAAGEFGGQIVAQGTPQQVAGSAGSVTGPYLGGAKAISIPKKRRMPAANSNTVKSKKPREESLLSPQPPGGGWLEILGARHNNLQNVDVRIPLGTLTAVTGVSGSGKSSIVEDVLFNALARRLHRASTNPGIHDSIVGIEWINKVIRVDQQPLGQSPTSNPATYTGVFELIRHLFAQLPASKVRGYTARRFSFNVPGGRCDDCEGNGQKRIEMHFLPDVWVQCETCLGKRYNPETLAVRFHGKSIADVLDMPCEQAVALFENIPKIRRILETLCDVGLGYVRLGQPAPTLSGGEAQRVKLAAELSRPDTGRTLYLLDEPTTGLHFDDLAKLLDVLNRLVDMGNTVVVIEHNIDVIKTADWIIDMGPEAGGQGGQLVISGTPEDVAAYASRSAKRIRGKSKEGALPLMRSYTGEILIGALKSAPYKETATIESKVEAVREGDMEIDEVGASIKMPWEVDGRKWHTEERVSRGGAPCEWDGRILAKVVDYIEKTDGFAAVDWNSRTIVEITGTTKSDGWFFHAITGEPWLLKMKFRVAKRTFLRDDLVERLKLPPLDELDHLPVYGSDPRVKCKNLRGPWQEIQLQVHSLSEIDRPEFWAFLGEAVQGFQKLTKKMKQKPEDVMPWKVLGRKWHFSRKGFPPGKRPLWDAELLEEICELLSDICPGGEFLWNSQQLIHLCPKGIGEPWATVYTKRLAGVDVLLSGPKDRVTLGRIADLAAKRELDTSRADKDIVKLRFTSSNYLAHGDLKTFLCEHLDATRLAAKESAVA